MKSSEHDKKLDELINRAISRERPTLDFDKWQKDHEKQIKDFRAETEPLAESVRPFEIWRIVMKSGITKLAAAAVIIIAFAFGIYFLTGPGVAFADVIRPILNAETAIFNIVLGEEGDGPVIQDMVMGSRIRRTVSTMDDVTIIDLDACRILELDPKEQKAVYYDLKGLPEGKITNYLETLRKVITELQDSPHFVVEELGEHEVDGQVAVGFRAKHPRVELTIWADPQTALPIRIESQEGQLFIICKDFQFDAEMDPELFSMDAPEGYTVQQAELDLFGSTEQDFIEGLRVWAEVLLGGEFPESIAIEDYVKQAPMIQEKMAELELSDDEEMELGMKMVRGILFIRMFKGEGKWYYAGKGIKLGDADTAIFWYRPKDSETFRVIYGDLTVEDVAPEDLPQPLPEEEEAAAGIGYQQWSKSEFVGSQQDYWHITAANEIAIHSRIELRKGPEDTSVMPIVLPYETGQLEAVLLGDETLTYHQVEQAQYDIELPLDRLLAGQTDIECVWRLPLEELRTEGEQGRRMIKLQSLIPVTFYKLTVVLEPDSNFVFTEEPSRRECVPFFGDSVSAKTDFGWSGILIQPLQ
jgi:hypothetical protein